VLGGGTATGGGSQGPGKHRIRGRLGMGGSASPACGSHDGWRKGSGRIGRGEMDSGKRRGRWCRGKGGRERICVARGGGGGGWGRSGDKGGNRGA